jgi:hypothetical protein
MATVRFSDELKGAIIKNAEAIFKKQIDDALSSYPKDWADRVYERAFASYIPSMNALPTCFFTEVSSLTISYIGDLRVGVACSLTNKRVFPHKLPTTADFTVEASSHYSNTELKLKDIAMYEDIKAEAIAYMDRVKVLRERQTAFVEQVRKIINAHATLAPALKMWQPLWDLVPEEYKERHRKVVERTKNEVTVDVDLGSLTAAVVAHKLTR